jgi:molybdate transport system regulatory protein
MATHKALPRRGSPSGLVPRVKVWLETDSSYAFGFGLAQMLQAIDRVGSIKYAARELGRSYRYVWGRIKAAERTLGIQLVEAHVGGAGVSRSSLTPAARRLTERFLAVRKRVMALVEREFAAQLTS